MLSKIWDVGWRTARLCAHETYMDTPYWEQLQYVGDTRIQALLSLYVGGDDRLVKNAIELFDESRLPDGLTQSRYPTMLPQIIPPFSLFWIGMMHDLYQWGGDAASLRQYLHGAAAVARLVCRRRLPRQDCSGGSSGGTSWTGSKAHGFEDGEPPTETAASPRSCPCSSSWRFAKPRISRRRSAVAETRGALSGLADRVAAAVREAHRLGSGQAVLRATRPLRRHLQPARQRCSPSSPTSCRKPTSRHS